MSGEIRVRNSRHDRPCASSRYPQWLQSSVCMYFHLTVQLKAKQSHALDGTILINADLGLSKFCTEEQTAWSLQKLLQVDIYMQTLLRSKAKFRESFHNGNYHSKWLMIQTTGPCSPKHIQCNIHILNFHGNQYGGYFITTVPIRM